jgi:hypothetical protein
MITYPPDEVASVRDTEARSILTQSGLPDARPAPFYPAEHLKPLEADADLLVLGNWGGEGTVIALDTTSGRVLGYTPWSLPIYQVSTSLRRFVDSVNAFNAAAPLSEDNPRYGGSLKAAAAHVLAELKRVDPEELSDPDSFWLDVVDDIKVGNFITE